MAHLLLPVASAFLSVPCPSGKRDRRPRRSGDLPFLVVVLCMACAALSFVAMLSPPTAAAVLALETLVVPQL